MKIQAGVAGTVYLNEARNLGGAWLKKASRLYENSMINYTKRGCPSYPWICR